MPMRNLLLVGCGGFLGSVARYYLTRVVTQGTHASRFPYGTLAVNVLGCLAIGVLAGLAEHRNLFSPATRLFLLTGLLGGFTTFSAFAFETWFLGREHAWAAGVANVGLQVMLGLAAVWAGHELVRR